MQHLQLTTPPTPTAPHTPSPPRKRRDLTATPLHLLLNTQDNMEEEQFPETTLHWDSDDDTKVPSSQDNDMQLSGREG